MTSPDATLMFHGTSDARLDSILKNGLRHDVGLKLSAALGGDDDHLVSLAGVYFAATPRHAEHYAVKAAEKWGGEPMLVSAVIPALASHPDEDHFLEFFRNWISDQFEFRFAQPEGFLDAWASDSSLRSSFISRASDALVANFQPREFQANEAVGKFLEAVFRNMTPEIFDQMIEWGGGHLDPIFLDGLLESPGGMDTYRERMTEITSKTWGTRPYDDFDNHSVRVSEPVGVHGPMFIAAIGTVDNPGCHYTNEVAGWRDLPGADLLDWDRTPELVSPR